MCSAVYDTVLGLRAPSSDTPMMPRARLLVFSLFYCVFVPSRSLMQFPRSLCLFFLSSLSSRLLSLFSPSCVCHLSKCCLILFQTLTYFAPPIMASAPGGSDQCLSRQRVQGSRLQKVCPDTNFDTGLHTGTHARTLMHTLVHTDPAWRDSDVDCQLLVYFEFQKESNQKASNSSCSCQLLYWKPNTHVFAVERAMLVFLL